MNIPDEAIEAAARIPYADYASEYEYAPWSLADRSPFLNQAKRTLEAAAPLIAAQAWHEGRNAGIYAMEFYSMPANPYRGADS